MSKTHSYLVTGPMREKRTDVGVNVRVHDANQALHESNVQRALSRARKGFNNIVDVSNDDEREAFIKKEIEEDEQALWDPTKI
jgi:hypothetical protein